MTLPDDGSVNPYQATNAPLVEARRVRRESTPEDRELLRRFQGQISTLAWAFVLIGSAALWGVSSIYVKTQRLPSDARNVVVMAVAIGAAVAALWLIVGIFSLFRHIWSAYVGLVLAYLTLLSSFKRPNIVAIVMLVAIIVLAHRAIATARKLQRLGIPLDAEPNSLHYARTLEDV